MNKLRLREYSFQIEIIFLKKNRYILNDIKKRVCKYHDEFGVNQCRKVFQLHHSNHG